MARHKTRKQTIDQLKRVIEKRSECHRDIERLYDMTFAHPNPDLKRIHARVQELERKEGKYDDLIMKLSESLL